jgi:hypothetical protein
MSALGQGTIEHDPVAFFDIYIDQHTDAETSQSEIEQLDLLRGFVENAVHIVQDREQFNSRLIRGIRETHYHNRFVKLALFKPVLLPITEHSSDVIPANPSHVPSDTSRYGQNFIDHLIVSKPLRLPSQNSNKRVPRNTNAKAAIEDSDINDIVNGKFAATTLAHNKVTRPVVARSLLAFKQTRQLMFNASRMAHKEGRTRAIRNYEADFYALYLVWSSGMVDRHDPGVFHRGTVFERYLVA